MNNSLANIKKRIILLLLLLELQLLELFPLQELLLLLEQELPLEPSSMVLKKLLIQESQQKFLCGSVL